jgi:hypothetical protein
LAAVLLDEYPFVEGFVEEGGGVPALAFIIKIGLETGIATSKLAP